ncbi:MAG: hypothetical protein JOZ90_01430 [Alphaproteobacteria bacterium]|nr:hypothetical protein [Alphaproteobacteria bacterium]MBV9370252.1 hypothetical protein [Alphaproteobacteria bacterium]MBV9899737.1 hypothetical protein [Alphaproteobacteria bacterium]
MKKGRLLLLAALGATAAPAFAAVTVLGSSAARMCYDAAESKFVTPAAGIERCNEALGHENLSDYDTVATYVNRGILRLRLGLVDEAIADFDRAIARDPDQAEAYVNKGMAMLRRSDGWSDAVTLFDTGIEKRTRRPAIAYFGRAVANEMGGHIKQAYLDYRQASLLEPRWGDPKAELSRFTVRQP